MLWGETQYIFADANCSTWHPALLHRESVVALDTWRTSFDDIVLSTLIVFMQADNPVIEAAPGGTASVRRWTSGRACEKSQQMTLLKVRADCIALVESALSETSVTRLNDMLEQQRSLCELDAMRLPR